MLRYNKKVVMFMASVLMIFTSCEKEELESYIGGNTVGFWIHSLNHSFYGMNNTEMPTDTIDLNIAVTGSVVHYDRYLKAESVPDAEGIREDLRQNTAIEGEHYHLLGGVVEAGEQYGKFRVVIINNDILQNSELKLNLSLKPNNDFEPGLKENQSVVLTWSRKVMQPRTWKDMRIFFCATYSTQVYKVIIMVTGLKEIDYYSGVVSQDEGRVMGRNFGNYIRQYEKDHGKPLLHDDGSKVGQRIISIY